MWVHLVVDMVFAPTGYTLCRRPEDRWKSPLQDAVRSVTVLQSKVTLLKSTHCGHLNALNHLKSYAPSSR